MTNRRGRTSIEFHAIAAVIPGRLLYPGEPPRIGGGDNHINAEGRIMLGKITASAVEEFCGAKTP